MGKMVSKFTTYVGHVRVVIESLCRPEGISFTGLAAVI